MRFIAALLFVLFAVPAAAQEPVTFDRTELTIVTAAGARHQFKTDWAKSWDQKARGLMFRKQMPLDHGMLLDYDPPQQASIWMRNTLIPLDIGYLNSDGELKEVYPMYPHDERSVRSVARRQLALEMNQGWFARHGVKPGAKLDLAALKDALRARGFKPELLGLP